MYVSSIVPRSMAALVYGLGTRLYTIGACVRNQGSSLSCWNVDQCIHESYDPTYYIHGVVITIIVSTPYPLQLHLVD